MFRVFGDLRQPSHATKIFWVGTKDFAFRHFFTVQPRIYLQNFETEPIYGRNPIISKNIDPVTSSKKSKLSLIERYPNAQTLFSQHY